MSELSAGQGGHRSAWAWLLDASVYFSFDASGYRRHELDFKPLPSRCDGLKVVVTGANSGIGYACAEALLKRGAELVMICRDQSRGEEARDRLSASCVEASPPRLVIADLADPESMRGAVEQLTGPLHSLIHNAGLLPLEWGLGPTGHEVCVAVHLLGPTLLTQLLSPQLTQGAEELKARGSQRGARVIWMSSGGMYTKALDVERIKRLSLPSEASRYDGVAAYAYTKRAQVELAAHLSELGHRAGLIEHHSVHPGWVDTPGVQRSLPRFWRWTRGRLRSLEQGADSAVWLACSEERLSPSLWFDRRARSPYLLGNRPPAGAREALLELLNEALELDPSWVNE